MGPSQPNSVIEADVRHRFVHKQTVLKLSVFLFRDLTAAETCWGPAAPVSALEAPPRPGGGRLQKTGSPGDSGSRVAPRRHTRERQGFFPRMTET